MHKISFFLILFLAFPNFIFAKNLDVKPKPLDMTRSSPNRQTKVLDNGKYILAWEADFFYGWVVFSVLAETTGFVGLGISHTGNMIGADLIIGGINDDNGVLYFEDYHSLGFTKPIPDPDQNWFTIRTPGQNATHTQLDFYRYFDTCDDNYDIQISFDTYHFIWSYGPTDDIEYHGPINRGSFPVHILDPILTLNKNLYEVWEMRSERVISTDKSEFWCNFHKRPDMNGKNHIVAFEPFYATERDEEMIHEMILYNCPAPVDQDPDEYFGPYIGDGWTCYTDPPEVVFNCQRFEFVGGKGGSGVVFPNNVGIPLNDDGRNQYFMLNIKYENHDEIPDITVNAGLNAYYTPNLRTNDGGMFEIGEILDTSHIVPPNAVEWTTAAHCPAECTSARIPPAGIRIFNGIMLAHKSANVLRWRHFRNGIERPWILYDERVDYTFIENRPLPEEIHVLPGDQIIFECTADTTFRNGSASIAGDSSRDNELFKSWAYYYPRNEFGTVASMYGSNILERFGIEEAEYNDSGRDVVVIAPEHLAGKMFTQVVAEEDWDQEKRNELEDELRFSEHYGFCAGSSWPLDLIEFRVQYPNVDEEYSPPPRWC